MSAFDARSLAIDSDRATLRAAISHERSAALEIATLASCRNRLDNARMNLSNLIFSV